MLPLATSSARRLLVLVAGFVAAGSLPPRTGAAQMIETESARLLPRGWWKVGGAFEAQTSGDGREGAVPLLVEYGIRDRLEIAVEPIPYTTIRPTAGRHASGAGDIEATLTWRLNAERPGFPALAFAGEVKVPTAHDSLIGTGRTDYAFYAIGSKRMGRFDVHANVSYTFVGSPAGTTLSNIVGVAAAAVYALGPRYLLFGEVLGNTSAGGAEPVPGGPAVVPEAAGGEVVGTVGAAHYLSSGLLLYAGVSYDNNAAVQLRTGLTLRFRPAFRRPPAPAGLR